MKLVACVGECEVWLVHLCASESQYESALALLSAAERDRACAIHGAQARRRFVLARAALRTRLADVLGISPERVALRRGEHGKPELVPAAVGGAPYLRGHGEPEIASPPSPHATVRVARVSQGLPRFNLAHGDGAALLAISHRRDDVGVDIERIAPESERPWRKLLERICHPSEAREALEEARTIGARAFYERWVGKEAVLKALGHGLRVSPAEVPLRRDGSGVLRVEEPPWRRKPLHGDDLLAGHAEAAARGGSGPSRCRLATVPTPAGLVGAVALVEHARAF